MKGKKGEEGAAQLYEDIELMEGYDAVSIFKSKTGKEKTWLGYKYNLRDFFRYIDTLDKYRGVDPDGLIENIKGLSFQDRYGMVDTLIGYRKNMENKGLRAKSIKTRLATVRSFFKKNRAELPEDGDLLKINPKTAMVRGSLSPADVRDMILSMNECYQAVFTSMFQAGLDLDCFTRWNRDGWVDLAETLRSGGTIHEICVNGRKGSKNLRIFYTYVGRDALDRIRNYVKDRPENGTAIFYTKNGAPVTKNSIYNMWMNHLFRLGKIEKKDEGRASRYGKNPHELRDTFISQFQKSEAGQESGQYFTGHVLDQNEYAKAYDTDRDFRIRKYRQGEPYLSLFSSDLPYGLVKAEAVDARLSDQNGELSQLKTDMDKMQRTIDTLYKMQIDTSQSAEYWKQVALSKMTEEECKTQLDSDAQETIKEMTKQLETTTNPQQRQILTNLIAALKAGWREPFTTRPDTIGKRVQ